MLPCVILCGGLATRLHPLTEQVPKSLVEVDGKPFLFHQLQLLRSHQICDVVLCIGYLGESIRMYAGDGSKFDITLRYSSDADIRLGTAGAVRKALDYLPECFFVLYGDSYLECDYEAIAQSFHRSGKLALMTIYRNEGSFDSSNVRAENGLILRYEKAAHDADMRYIDYGLGVFSRSIFEALPPGRVIDLQSVYQDLLAQGELACYEVSQRFYEIGSIQGLHDLERHLSS